MQPGPPGGTLMTLTYGYDAANQLTTYSGPEGTLTYTYDNDGELTNVGGARTETYSYDTNGNRTMTGYTTGTGNRLTADGTYTYAYDNEGNMTSRTRTSDGQVTNYTWDFRNRLTEVLIKTSSGTTVQDDKFTYDVENRRIGKSTYGGSQTWTVYDGQNAYADFTGSTLTMRYLMGPVLDFLLGRVDPSGNPIWYLTDNLGSVRMLVDSSGNNKDQLTYDSYGNILTETNSANGDRFKFTGREWDSEIAQYFYRARSFAPTIGRFESEDPKGFSAGDTNLYRYVKNDPTTNLDATGLDFPGGPGTAEWAKWKQEQIKKAEDEKLRQIEKARGAIITQNNVMRTRYQHTNILIVPTNQNKWKNHPWSKTTPNGVVYLTLGAGPSGLVGSGSGNYILMPKPNGTWGNPKHFDYTLMQNITIPKGMSEDQFIQKLLDLFDYYEKHDPKFPYPTIAFSPNAGSDVYNSNSFAFGLLQAAGAAQNPEDFPDTPGAEGPINPYYFVGPAKPPPNLMNSDYYKITQGR